MSVRPETLEHGERDLALQDRDVKSGRKSGVSPEAALAALRQRIATALAREPNAPIPECQACYRKGWRAALQSLIDGEPG
jgi:hypothetical protein